MALTPSDVRLVIRLPDTVTDEEIQASIDDATLIVAQCSGVASLSADVQTAILKYVTAHLMSALYGKSGVVTSETLGDASTTYASGGTMFGQQLDSTPYGQRALLLDSTGCLRRLGRMRPIFQKV
jgi:hypothetical protein